MEFSIRNRIAGLYVLVTAIIAAFVFLLLYYVVHKTMYDHLDGELQTESTEVFKSIVVLSNQFVFANPFEWKEGEHRQVEVNPTFLQIIDTAGITIKKSENLLEANLAVRNNNRSSMYYNTVLSHSSIRQFQTPIISTENNVLGYLLIAIPLSEVEMLLTNLQYLLVIAYPLVLIALFLSSRFIAGKSIAPIDTVITTAETISKENLDRRIDLPKNKDELYRLTATINQLLDRLQEALLREKQFTSDASHELRTPLTSIKGTLEVLLRKPRTTEHYSAKISETIDEVNKLSRLIDQLLAFARFDNGLKMVEFETIDLVDFMHSIVSSMKNELKQTHTTILAAQPGSYLVYADREMLRSMVQNIFSNAIKYSTHSPRIGVVILAQKNEIVLNISDNGPGISKEHLPYIFNRFYRIDQSRASEISGSGLGLSLVERYATMQRLTVTVESEPDQGTAFSIHFPPK